MDNQPGFIGFQTGTPFIRIPEEFFTKLLPDIKNPETLKIVLYAFWRLNKSEAEAFYLTRKDFLEDQVLMEALVEISPDSLSTALLEAEKNGVFIRVPYLNKGSKIDVYFINSPKGREASEALLRGQWEPSLDRTEHIELMQQGTNAFKLYEENIGPLTPMISEIIRADEATFPAKWIEDAVVEAVKRNKRSWSYIQAILKRWQANGR